MATSGMHLDHLTIELSGSHDSGVCPCCGNTSRRVWGYVYADGDPLAVYSVHWTPGHVAESGANIDLIVGKWGDEARPEDRSAIALDYRLLASGPALMVVDAVDRSVADSDLVGRALRRSEVIGTETAKLAFAITDMVLLQDERIGELLDMSALARVPRH